MINSNKNFSELKFGFFVHYVYAGTQKITINSDGSAPGSLEFLAESFDPQKFADDIESFGVDYIIFTAWHANQNPLYPSKGMLKWGLDSHYCKRDLIGEMIAAVKSKGIAVILYTHPRDGHDMNLEDQQKTGWGGNKITEVVDPDPEKFDYKKWNSFIQDCYAEVVDRYGKDISGIYIDEGNCRADSDRLVDYKALREIIKSRYEHITMIQNYYGNLYTCDTGDKEYSYSGEFAQNDGSKWPCNSLCVGTVMGGQFWAIKPLGELAVRFSVRDMFRYTVLQAGANTQGGGVQWAAGPYPDGNWETGVKEAMIALGRLIDEIAISIKGTIPSTSYVTNSGETIESIKWGVATKSIDGHSEYLHILKPPVANMLVLPLPADRKRFTSARILNAETIVRVTNEHNSLVITLPDNYKWSDLCTTIELLVF